MQIHSEQAHIEMRTYVHHLHFNLSETIFACAQLKSVRLRPERKLQQIYIFSCQGGPFLNAALTSSSKLALSELDDANIERPMI